MEVKKKKKSIAFRIIRTVLIVLLIIILVLAGSLLFIGLPTFDFTGKAVTGNDYTHIMRDSISSDPRVVDIAMLGAHDAFTNKIDKKSAVDPNEDPGGIINNKFVRGIAGGLFVRVAKAQKSTAYDMLKRGVRYFDARVTRYDDDWYSMHGLISDRFEIYLSDTLKFLAESEKELIIFNMHHAYPGDMTMDDLLEFLDSVKYQGKSIFDYVRHDPTVVSVGELKYSEATAGGSGVIILLDYQQTAGCKYYSYEGSIRSNWHNKNSEKKMLEGIAAEYNELKEDSELDRDKFRVNQVQMTGKYSLKDLINTIFGWSLLDMAESFNPKLLKQPDFKNWFEVLPIFMTDYADSMKDGFNDNIISAVNQFNAALGQI